MEPTQAPADASMIDPDRRPDHASAVPPAPPRNASLLEVVVAVFSSFLGIRRGKAMRRDEVAIKPQQVIIVGVVLAAVLVLGLLLLVRVIIHAAGA